MIASRSEPLLPGSSARNASRKRTPCAWHGIAGWMTLRRIVIIALSLRVGLVLWRGLSDDPMPEPAAPTGRAAPAPAAPRRPELGEHAAADGFAAVPAASRRNLVAMVDPGLPNPSVA